MKLGGIARYRLDAIDKWLQNVEPHHGPPS